MRGIYARLGGTLSAARRGLQQQGSRQGAARNTSRASVPREKGVFMLNRRGVGMDLLVQIVIWSVLAILVIFIVKYYIVDAGGGVLNPLDSVKP